MRNNKLFYKYYDHIYRNKDYIREIDEILRIYRCYSVRKLSSAIEIGCGTGAHSIELAGRGIDTLAVDIDKDILEIAKQKKLKSNKIQLRFALKDISVYKSKKKYDMAFALFNVVNYLITWKSMYGFFKGVNNALKPGAVFIFDCYNGAAVIQDPPQKKKVSLNYKGDLSIDLNLSPENDILFQKGSLNYDIRINDNGRKYNIKHKIIHSFWTAGILKEILGLCNFEVLLVSKWMDFRTKAGVKDWKIMFVCRKVR
ncbi:MAG: hypothetical protein CVU78_01235 [Elusimicrobia bacterium HGW-Elusimicrobia-2]|nr:MAG: hypothetical protein CVU78_01235 [Elusimicrobia bacterium HGW-Elusimicrobia-2]